MIAYDKRRYYDKSKEPFDDPEWIAAETEPVVPHYYWVNTGNGKYVKLYKPGVARLTRERTGWEVSKIYTRRAKHHDKRRSNRQVRRSARRHAWALRAGYQGRNQGYAEDPGIRRFFERY